MERRTRGEGGLYKRGDGMWIGSVDIPTDDGTRRRKTVSSKNKAKALSKLRELRRNIEEGQVPTTGTTTVERWLDHWLETIQRPHCRPTTYRYYESTIRLYINPAIGPVPLDKLTPAKVRVMLAALSSRNAQKVHQVLRLALGDAKREGMMFRNAVEYIDKPRHVAIERKPFTFEEARQIILTAKNDPLGTMWAAMFFTGAREGEILGMELDRCDLDAGLFDFSWQLQQIAGELPAGFEYRPCYKSLLWTRPKTKAGRRVAPMTAPVLQMMREYDRMHTGPNPHGLVWHHQDGRPVSPREAAREWKALVERAGVPYRSMHSARHTTSTLLNNAGVSQETRMKVIGHSSVVAQQIYVHVDHEPARAALSNLNELLS
ncbi:site-specific integrase [Mycobacteroides abscessus]|uniref:site-specific integrase n=1 Tax=Mycobacteroides abscessus TaxID=36809 RepID=UPI001E5AC64B|nr:site-specific integrase [Mycobacteroides abscessus]